MQMMSVLGLDFRGYEFIVFLIRPNMYIKHFNILDSFSSSVVHRLFCLAGK